MELLRIMIVDDDLIALDELEYELKSFEGFKIIGKFNNSVEALKFLRQEKPDVVFLDIDMPDINGIIMAQEIIAFNPLINIIFVTSYNHYAVKAFEMNVLDYILKPISSARLANTMARLKKNKSNEDTGDKRIQVLTDVNRYLKIKKLPVWDNDCILLINIYDIVYCTSDTEKEKDSLIRTKNGSYRSNNTLGNLEVLLADHGIIRCHKSFLINVDFIEKIIPWFNRTYSIKMQGIAEEVPVSRTYTKTIKGMFGF